MPAAAVATAPDAVADDPGTPPAGATGESLTAAAFMATSFPDDRPRELVRGWVVVADDWMAGRPAFCQTPPVPPPGPRHGRACFRVAKVLDAFVEPRGLGTVFTNDVAVRTGPLDAGGATGERDGDGGDSVRGGDVLFYDADTLPLDADLPDDPLADPPRAIFEVRSPSDRPGRFRAKAREYLAAGVTLVGWLDPRGGTLTLFDDPAAGDLGERVLSEDDTFEAGAAIPGFTIPVRSFLRR